MAKLTPLLEKRLSQAAPGDLVEVVIEVAQGPKQQAPTTRADRHAAFAHAFGVSTKALTELIASVGGKVLATSWLSGAIKAQLPAESVEQLRSADNVEVIDVPRQLTRG